MPLLTALALIQAAVLSRLSLWGARPNLVLLFILAWSVLRGSGEGQIWALVGGLVLDVVSGGPTGSSILSLMVAAVVAGRARASGLRSHLARLLLVSPFAVGAYHAVLVGLMAWDGRPVDPAYAVSGVIGPSIVFNVLLAPLVYVLLSWLDRQTRREGLAL